MSERSTMLSVRTSPEVKAKLAELAKLMGERLGTRVTQTQALEMAIANALESEAGK